jgi:uncharacterized repeat protein (TIGR03803 family)
MPYKHLALCMVLLAAGCNANQALRLPDANLSAKRTDLQVGKHSQSSGYSVLYNFAGAPTDGYEPFGGVFLDGDGSLYGTTFYGGTLPSQPCQIGCGTAFRLTPGAPRDDVLHSFAGPPHDGFGSFGGISAHSGVLYGTSAAGGTKDSGTVFELTRSGRGDWTEKILYAFKGPPSDGSGPSDIAIDPHGVIYGTTFNGGSGTTCFFKTSGCGTVFELMSPAHAGQRWHETVLHNFKGSPDGAGPSGSLVLGSNGAVYGTAAYGGASTECPYLGGCGAVFKLRHARSRWTETIIHSFNVAASSTDGSLPSGSLIAGANGTLIGTTRYGGGLPG